MDRLAHDVRIALRGFRRTPAFTATVLAILALGIGMASTMAAVSDAVLRRRLPVVAPERVVALWPTREGTEISLMSDDLERVRHDSRTMRAIAGFVHWGAVPYAVTDGDRPLVLPQSRVTGNFFDVLGTRPVLLPQPREHLHGHEVGRAGGQEPGEGGVGRGHRAPPRPSPRSVRSGAGRDGRGPDTLMS